MGETQLMLTGRVKFFNADGGYCFIAPVGGGSDVFVHVHEVESAGMKTLAKGQLQYRPARDGCLKAVIFARYKLETPHLSEIPSLFGHGTGVCYAWASQHGPHRGEATMSAPLRMEE
jgi:cold shock CspA family protein